METTERTQETWAAAINRLARQARTNGVTIYCHDLGTRPEYFATSVSRPGYVHRTTALSCDCLGFIGHHRCQHVAALLDHIGELPELPTDPDPDPPATAPQASIPNTGNVSASHAAHIEAQGRKWLQSLLDRDAAGEDVAERDIREAVDMVIRYAGIAGSTEPVPLAA